MTSDLAICYVADNDYLYPTLLSIASLRRFPTGQSASIFLFCLDANTPQFRSVVEYGRTICVTVLPLSLKDQLRHDKEKWNRTHVPEATLGRFYIEPLLPPEISRILYVDGDTLFVGDPAPLLDLRPAADTLAAAEDISFFSRRDWGTFGRRTRAYRKGLGIALDAGYFNSGVLMTGRDLWRRIAREAAEFFIENTERCTYHDQSALNAVVGSRRIRISPAWNFQTPFRYWDMEAAIAPRILHFTGFPKPWMAKTPPWADVHRIVEELGAELKPLDLPVRRLSADEAAKYNSIYLRRKRRLSLFPVRLLHRRREMCLLAKSAVI